MPIHVRVDETEDYCLVAHQCLVVAFTIAHGLFVGTSVCQLPEYRTGLPVLVGLLLDGLYPIVGYVHRHAIVEPVSSVGKLGSQAWHSAHLFCNGDGLWVDLMYKEVGKREIADCVVVLMSVEIILIAAERFAKTVAIIEH